MSAPRHAETVHTAMHGSDYLRLETWGVLLGRRALALVGIKLERDAFTSNALLAALGNTASLVTSLEGGRRGPSEATLVEAHLLPLALQLLQ